MQKKTKLFTEETIRSAGMLVLDDYPFGHEVRRQEWQSVIYPGGLQFIVRGDIVAVRQTLKQLDKTLSNLVIDPSEEVGE